MLKQNYITAIICIMVVVAIFIWVERIGGNMNQDNSENEDIKNMDGFYKSPKFKDIISRIVELKIKQNAPDEATNKDIPNEQKEAIVNKIQDSITSEQGKLDIVNKMAEYEKKQNSEIGMASWLGTTGLGTDTESRLISYLRRELGTGLFGGKSLEANDLSYVGVFTEGAQRVHYWRVNWGNYNKEEVYATVIFDPAWDGGALGVGGRNPPK